MRGGPQEFVSQHCPHLAHSIGPISTSEHHLYLTVASVYIDTCTCRFPVVHGVSQLFATRFVDF